MSMRHFAASTKWPIRRLYLLPRAGVWVWYRHLWTYEAHICGFDCDGSLWWLLVPGTRLCPCGILPQAPNGPFGACICYHGLVFGSGTVTFGPMKHIYVDSTVMGRFGGCWSQERSYVHAAFCRMHQMAQLRLYLLPRAGVWVCCRHPWTYEAHICGFDCDGSLWWLRVPGRKLCPCGILPHAPNGPVDACICYHGLGVWGCCRHLPSDLRSRYMWFRL